MAAEASRQIEHSDLIELKTVFAEHDLQASHIGPLCLRQLVDVLLKKVDAALGVERYTFESVLEAAHRVHATGANQFAQQIDEAGSADPFRRHVADHAEPERSVAFERDVLDRTVEARHA